MFELFYGFLLAVTLPLNLLSYVIIFIGSFYIALHCRNLPNWLVTPMWYTGISAFLTGLSIILQWILGEDFPLSYYNTGLMCELMLHISLGITIGLLFFNTVRKDIDGAKRRCIKNKKGKVRK
jgi:hypothetical protein